MNLFSNTDEVIGVGTEGGWGGEPPPPQSKMCGGGGSAPSVIMAEKHLFCEFLMIYLIMICPFLFRSFCLFIFFN